MARIRTKKRRNLMVEVFEGINLVESFNEDQYEEDLLFFEELVNNCKQRAEFNAQWMQYTVLQCNDTMFNNCTL